MRLLLKTCLRFFSKITTPYGSLIHQNTRVIYFQYNSATYELSIELLP